METLRQPDLTFLREISNNASRPNLFVERGRSTKPNSKYGTKTTNALPHRSADTEFKSEINLEVFAPEIDQIVDNLAFVMDKNGLQTIGVTSVLPKEGTTSMAVVLALSFAAIFNKPGRGTSPDLHFLDNQGKKKHGALLIDAQFSAPAIGGFLKETYGTGLIDNLISDISWVNSIRKISQANLSVLPYGSPSDLKWRKEYVTKLHEILDEVKQYYEMVFIDLPSVLQHANSVSLAGMCDGVVLVVQADRTTKAQIFESKKRLLASNVNIIGTILNRSTRLLPSLIGSLF
ncbi:MAG: CpsD/CapB family tyrosine-protein kinase [Deferribacteres bacterium]|nr:CpsD/CapB family tyrosine-protein kinase [candidate division KSB1 bacterium]MCB9504283.1 CpsD/CapB family tyrosine-protein kinase [Deferribacteres bacterium]